MRLVEAPILPFSIDFLARVPSVRCLFYLPDFDLEEAKALELQGHESLKGEGTEKSGIP